MFNKRFEDVRGSMMDRASVNKKALKVLEEKQNQVLFISLAHHILLTMRLGKQTLLMHIMYEFYILHLLNSKAKRGIVISKNLKKNHLLPVA